MSKSSMVLKNMAVKLVVFGLFIILSGNLNLAAAQEPGPVTGEPACTDHGTPSYDEWVKDLPCKPRYLADETTSRQAPEGGLEGAPDGSNGPAYYSNWVYLAYESYQDGNWEIYGAKTWFNTGVQGATRMTVHTASDINPRVRPGSPQVAFASNRSGAYEIYLMDWGGSHLKQLTFHQSYAGQPAWSPDGSKLAFVSEIDGNQEIYVMDADGSHQIRLTYSVKDDFGPYWSPDGSQILWIQALDQTYGVINVMNADGANPHAITEKLRYVEHPAWSPEGGKVVFDYDSNQDDWFDIGWMDANGQNLAVRVYGETNVDYLAGPWSMFNPDYFLATHIQYVIYDRQYYIYSSCVATIHQAFGYPDCMDYSELDFLPDAALVDVVPPKTQVDPLPPYVRPGKFQVKTSGLDIGVSGLYTTLLQYRLGLQGTWTELGTISPGTPGPFEMDPEVGQTLYFRSQGQDWAFNIEPWPDTWDTYTQVYAWQLDGSVLDNRGVGVAKASVSSQPVFSDQIDAEANGGFHRYVPTSPVTVEVSKKGYNSLPKSTIASLTDLEYTWVLPPADNLIQNGGLESGLSSWQNSGIYDVHLDQGFQHSGSASAEFGWTGSASETGSLPNLTVASSQPEAVEGPDGTLHATWKGWNVNGPTALYYSSKTITGTWTAPITITVPSNYGIIDQKLAVGSDGSLVVVWSRFNSDQSGIFATSRSPEGVWSDIEDISGPVWMSYGNNFYSLDLVLDSQNTVHVIWFDGTGVVYTQKPKDGVWSTPEIVLPGAGGLALAAAPDQTLYLVRIALDVSYISRSPGGVWSQPVVIANESGNGPAAAIDTLGNLHIIWSSTSGVYYSKVSKTGVVSTPRMISGDGLIFEMTLLVKSDRAHVFWKDLTGMKYRRQLNSSLWSPVMTFQVNEPNVGLSLAAQDDRVYGFWPEGAPQTPHIAYAGWEIPEDYQSSFSQAVALPSNLHRPTLSFMESITNTGASGNLEVLVNDQSVFSTSQHQPQWSHHWVDLTPWLGQTITLTFQAENDFSQGLLDAHIDDVSIGSWLTPILDSVAPGEAKAGTPLVLTLTGDNFIDPTTLHLNDQASTGLKYIDEHTLELTLSSGLKPGIYDVWVANPGGQEALLPAALKIGERIFLPLLNSKR